MCAERLPTLSPTHPLGAHEIMLQQSLTVAAYGGFEGAQPLERLHLALSFAVAGSSELGEGKLPTLSLDCLK